MGVIAGTSRGMSSHWKPGSPLFDGGGTWETRRALAQESPAVRLPDRHRRPRRRQEWDWGRRSAASAFRWARPSLGVGGLSPPPDVLSPNPSAPLSTFGTPAPPERHRPPGCLPAHAERHRHDRSRTSMRRKIAILAALLVAVLATGTVVAVRHESSVQRAAPPPAADTNGAGRRRCGQQPGRADLSARRRYRDRLQHRRSCAARSRDRSPRSTSPKGRPCMRAICSHRSIRGPIRRRSIR